MTPRTRYVLSILHTAGIAGMILVPAMGMALGIIGIGYNALECFSFLFPIFCVMNLVTSVCFLQDEPATRAKWGFAILGIFLLLFLAIPRLN